MNGFQIQFWLQASAALLQPYCLLRDTTGMRDGPGASLSERPGRDGCSLSSSSPQVWEGRHKSQSKSDHFKNINNNNNTLYEARWQIFSHITLSPIRRHYYPHCTVRLWGSEGWSAYGFLSNRSQDSNANLPKANSHLGPGAQQLCLSEVLTKKTAGGGGTRRRDLTSYHPRSVWLFQFIRVIWTHDRSSEEQEENYMLSRCNHHFHYADVPQMFLTPHLYSFPHRPVPYRKLWFPLETS